MWVVQKHFFHFYNLAILEEKLTKKKLPWFISFFKSSKM
jgi:hypothetical protein